MRRPFLPTKSADSSGLAICARTASQALSAVTGMAAHRHDARLAALAGDAHRAIVEIDIAGGQGSPARPGAGRRNTAARTSPCRAYPAASTAGNSTSFTASSGDSACGSSLGAFGGRRPTHGLSRRLMVAHQVIEKAAPGRQRARQSVPAQPLPVQLRDIAADLVAFQIRRAACSRQAGTACAGRARNFRGMFGVLAFVGQVRKEAGEQLSS